MLADATTPHADSASADEAETVKVVTPTTETKVDDTISTPNVASRPLSRWEWRAVGAYATTPQGVHRPMVSRSACAHADAAIAPPTITCSTDTPFVALHPAVEVSPDASLCVYPSICHYNHRHAVVWDAADNVVVVKLRVPEAMAAAHGMAPREWRALAATWRLQAQGFCGMPPVLQWRVPALLAAPPAQVMYHAQLSLADAVAPQPDVLAGPRCEPLSTAERRAIAYKLCGTVATLWHAHGMAHMDITPQHILLSKLQGYHAAQDIQVWLTSWGHSTALPTSMLCPAVRGVTSVAAACAACAFVAPECLVGAACSGTAADAWALGMVLLFLFDGTPLFDASSAVGVFHQQCQLLGVPRHDRAPWHDHDMARRAVASAAQAVVAPTTHLPSAAYLKGWLAAHDVSLATLVFDHLLVMDPRRRITPRHLAAWCGLTTLPRRPPLWYADVPPSKWFSALSAEAQHTRRIIHRRMWRQMWKCMKGMTTLSELVLATTVLDAAMCRHPQFSWEVVAHTRMRTRGRRWQLEAMCAAAAWVSWKWHGGDGDALGARVQVSETRFAAWWGAAPSLALSIAKAERMLAHLVPDLVSLHMRVAARTAVPRCEEEWKLALAAVWTLFLLSSTPQVWYRDGSDGSSDGATQPHTEQPPWVWVRAWTLERAAFPDMRQWWAQWGRRGWVVDDVWWLAVLTPLPLRVYTTLRRQFHTQLWRLQQHMHETDEALVCPPSEPPPPRQ